MLYCRYRKRGLTFREKHVSLFMEGLRSSRWTSCFSALSMSAVHQPFYISILNTAYAGHYVISRSSLNTVHLGTTSKTNPWKKIKRWNCAVKIAGSRQCTCRKKDWGCYAKRHLFFLSYNLHTKKPIRAEMCQVLDPQTPNRRSWVLCHLASVDVVLMC